MKIIIPTKGRSDVIGDKALRLFPDATLCVGDDEQADYAKVSDRLLVHPAGVAASVRCGIWWPLQLHPHPLRLPSGGGKGTTRLVVKVPR